ncbi:hypothetical protein FKP32DRAFT_1645100 [Trametes sanguinea]|nr:hypothetical protein FKP32DRAFT_1645100 [Trametes sanguinea]
MGANSDNPILNDVAEGEDVSNTFTCLHFSWYCRSATSGHTVPPAIHPLTLTQQNKKRTNHHQMVPYTSKEVTLHQDEYRNLCDAFEEFFLWMDAKLRQYLPQLHEEIAMYADILPGNSASPSYPFSGFVINFNVTTKVHRDHGDLHACLVLPIGRFKGGEVCMAEPGLVTRIQSGDIIIFKSWRISHFNLPYTGKRASLVCHSDRAGLTWVKDRMGWKGHSYFDDEDANDE